MANVEKGTARFDESMKALQSNFLFRGYFRKKKSTIAEPATLSPQLASSTQ